MAVRGNYIYMQCMAAKGYAETEKRASAGWTHESLAERARGRAGLPDGTGVASAVAVACPLALVFVVLAPAVADLVRWLA